MVAHHRAFLLAHTSIPFVPWIEKTLFHRKIFNYLIFQKFVVFSSQVENPQILEEDPILTFL